MEAASESMVRERYIVATRAVWIRDDQTAGGRKVVGRLMGQSRRRCRVRKIAPTAVVCGEVLTRDFAHPTALHRARPHAADRLVACAAKDVAMGQHQTS